MNAAADPREARLLNEFQHGFPLVREPFGAIAGMLGTDADWVRTRLARWQHDGRVSRVGAVFRPGAIGVSTLAALAVPPDELDRVAAMVSARPEVNHNYEREHRHNLWFVATAPDRAALDARKEAKPAGSAVEKATASAPVGGDVFAATMQSMLNASTKAFDNMTGMAKQLSDIAEANMAAASKVAAPAKSATAAAAKKAAK